MDARGLHGVIETPDGAVVPGSHATAARTNVPPHTSGSVGLIADRGEALLVDTGGSPAPDRPPGVGDVVDEMLQSRDLDLRYVVQTHFHFDHAGNTARIVERFGGTVLCHPLDRPILENPATATTPAYLESFGGDPARVAADLNLDDPGALLPSGDRLQQQGYAPVPVDDTVEDGDVLEVGDLAVEVHHTPGHTPGHLSLFVPGSRSLYLADVMYWPTPLLPHPIGRAEAQRESVAACLDLEATYLYPGHGLPRYGRDDVTDYLGDLLVKQRALPRRLLVLLSRHGPLAVPELHAETFPIEPRYDYAVDGRFGSGHNCVQSHLRRMAADGLVERIERDDGATAWAVTAAGRRPDRDLAVAGPEARGPLAIDDVLGDRRRSRQ